MPRYGIGREGATPLALRINYALGVTTVRLCVVCRLLKLSISIAAPVL